MKHTRIVACVMMAAVHVAGCGTPDGSVRPNDVLKLQLGMTADEVRLMLGDPDSANDCRMGTAHDFRYYYYFVDGKRWTLEFDEQDRLDRKSEYSGGDIMPWAEYVSQCKNKGRRP